MSRESTTGRSAHVPGGARRRWRLAVAVAAAAVTIAAAGCGSSDSSDAGSTQGSTSTAAGSGAAPNMNQSAARSIEVALEYTGGKEGKADPSLPAIGIGWANADHGNLAQAWGTRGVKAAIDFVNEHLGGVQGHPLKLIQGTPCEMGANEQQGTLCAQALLNNPEVKVILAHPPSVGGRSFNAATLNNGRVPVVSATPLSPSDVTAKSAYFTAGGPLSVPALAKFVSKDLKAKTMAQVWPDEPALTPVIDGYKKLLESVGVEATIARIPPNSPDVTTAVAAAQPTSQDVIQVFPFSPAQCAAVAKALTSLQATDTPAIGSNPCLDPSVKEQLGDFPHWMYFSSEPNPFIEDPTGRVGATVWALKQYDAEHWEADIQAPLVQAYFGLVLTIAQWVKGIDPEKIDVDSINPVIRAFHGPVWGGPPHQEFGKAPAPALGANAVRFSEYLGDGKWQYRSDWVNAGAPPS